MANCEEAYIWCDLCEDDCENPEYRETHRDYCEFCQEQCYICDDCEFAELLDDDEKEWW